ncbi:monovalent cation/H(+) antiporter subunit G [Paracoccus sp. ME4]|uniref:monovalent cation/H(+) antiporter subunit G n=1 Tax=Paracoccus sp. ME4 TaxID=3138066 RepID=UPI00398AC07A
MTDLPVWLSLLIAAFLVLGSTLALIGAWGFLRLRSFYDRLHAPTLATSWGTGGIVIASMLLASWTQDRIVMHEIVVGAALLATVPVTLMLLGRAALHRDRSEGSTDVPAARAPDTTPPSDAPLKEPR